MKTFADTITGPQISPSNELLQLKTGEVPKVPAGQIYNFKNFDIEQGLEISYITCIYIDKKGQVWFGTLGQGVGKYDGVDFIYYTTHHGLGSNRVQSILEDKAGNMWFGTEGGGVTKFDGFSFVTYDDKNGLSNNRIWSIFQDSKENLWFCTFGGGLCSFNGKGFNCYTTADGLASNNVWTIYEDRSGKLWIGTYDRGLSVYDGKEFKTISTNDGLSNNNVEGLVEDDKGNMWIGTYGGGITIIKDKAFEYISADQGLENSYVNSLLKDNKGRIWIATSGGGVYFQDGNSLKSLSKKQGLSNDVVLKMAQDIYGNIWFATYGGGISRYNGECFSHFTTDEGLSNNVVRGITEDDSGMLWFGTVGGGLNSYDGSYISHYQMEQGMASSFIMSLTFKNNKILISTSGGGAGMFDGKSVRWLMKQKGLGNNLLFSAIIDVKGIWWMGTYGMGACKYDGENITSFNTGTALANESIHTIFEDSKKNIWFGTEKSGAFIFDGKDFKKIGLDEGLKSNYIVAICEDSKGIIWIGTNGGGLARYENGEIISLTEEGGLRSNYVNSLLSDKKGNLWIGTSNGLTKLIPATDGVYSKKNDLPEFLGFKIKTFGINEGFSGNNCMENSIFEDSRGDIWIGTGRMLTKYRHDEDHINNIEPNTFLKRIRLFFEEPDWREKDSIQGAEYDSVTRWNNIPLNLKLPYDKNHLTFDFIGISLKYPEKVEYRFMLEGLETDWNPPTKKAEATYTNLQPGFYTFKVKAKNEDGIWNNEAVQYSFTIIPPWWSTLWFKILGLVFIIFAIAAYIKIREKKLRKDKQKLEKTVLERTQELREKNEELFQSNEEIKAQRDQIEMQKDEILAQRDLVVEQKEQIEEIHHEISQSIDYATRLQSAILSDNEVLAENLSDHFVLFRPKDKVSGDFYWWAHIEGHTIITVADCTGHGVPGAFMSMLGISFLREIVLKEYITHPGVILRKMRKEIIKTLKQKGETGEQVDYDSTTPGRMKDGMDMALISIEKKSKILSFAGANNPMYLIRNGELTEYKADKMPIAIYEKMDKFTCHEVQLQTNDCLYLFSDGMADQFGGPKGKKFKYKPFKQILEESCNMSMPDQKAALETSLDDWMEPKNKNDEDETSTYGKTYEQVDDITVLGLRI